MKKYEKPMMQVERYSAKNAVATGCFEEEKTSYDAQQITCIIEGTEYIFDQSTNKSCKDDVSSGYLGKFDGDYYFVWYNGKSNGQPTAEQTATLSAIEKAVMGNSSAVGVHGWHAGTVSATKYKEMNSTS